MSIERLSLAAAQRVIQSAASATGADFAYLLNTARRESSFTPGAQATTSSAAGLFQFIESTWLNTLSRYGEKHGVAQSAADARSNDPSARARALDLRFDPDLSAKLAGELAKENGQFLERKLGRPASGTELYAAHVLGPVGAVKLIEAASSGQSDAAKLFPAAARANGNLFYTKSGAPLNAAGVLERLAHSPEDPQRQTGIASNPRRSGLDFPDDAIDPAKHGHGALVPNASGQGLAAPKLFESHGLFALLAQHFAVGNEDIEPLQRAARAYLENARQNFVNRNGGHSAHGSSSDGSS